MKKIILCFAFLSLLLGFRIAFADVIINEVQISPTNERFIELYNSSSSDVDLTGWYIQRKTESGSDFTSLVSKTNFENKKISSSGYFLISRSAMSGADIVLGNLTLTDSNTIQIKNSDQEVVDSIVLGGAIPNPVENESVQKTSNGWVVANPTPGEANENIDTSSDDSNSSSDGANSDITVKKKIEIKKEKVIEVPSIKAKILANNLAFTGQPFKLKTNVLGYSNENIVLGKVYWNFGDGKSFEQINNFGEFSHIYYYPGEYALVLEYYKSNFSKIPDAVAKMTVKVLPTTVVISRVGDMKDFFVELTNNASSDIDISNWYLKTNGRFFVFPKNSVILSKKQMTIPGMITGFKYGNQYDLKLFSATNELIFDYNSQNLQENNIQNKKVVIINENNFVQIKEEAQKSIDLILEKSEIPKNSIEASPILSQENSVVGDKNQNKSYLFFWGFVVLLIVSSGIVYYIRQNRDSKNEGEDFEILDE